MLAHLSVLGLRRFFLGVRIATQGLPFRKLKRGPAKRSEERRRGFLGVAGFPAGLWCFVACSFPGGVCVVASGSRASSLGGWRSSGSRVRRVRFPFGGRVLSLAFNAK